MRITVCVYVGTSDVMETHPPPRWHADPQSLGPHPPLIRVVRAKPEDEVCAATHGVLQVARQAGADLTGEVEGHAL